MATSKEKLLREAFRLFVTQGYDRTSMSDLAKAANVSKGAFHHYYPRKQDILDACLATYFNEGLPQSPEPEVSTREYARTASRAYATILARLRSEGISLIAYQAFLWTMIRDGHIDIPKLARDEEGLVDMELITALIEGAGVLATLTDLKSDDDIHDLFDRIVSRGFQRS
ncbi:MULTISPECIES: helix-turn-helix domain-containing protein [unclassified Yoonia]|uniref:TetR/AcrR family transcriptional regulator n=1 Tax=unclassified Yoonia TaxID=2629118 RepID=UPI002AFEB3F1|nr:MULTISPECIES: helix-turn-helix domain-containing protein [unclassified Yoonia]